MGTQATRQAARRAAVARMSVRRAEQLQRERRIDRLAVDVVVALEDRDAAERRAGQGLATLVDGEGLTVRDVADRCGDALTAREAIRLRRRLRAETGGADGSAAVEEPPGSPDPGRRDDAVGHQLVQDA